MAVSWFDGPASAFVDGCERMSSDTRNPMVSHHLIGSPDVDLAGDRALADTRTTILARLEVDAIPSDVTIVARFFDLLLRQAEGWKIHRRATIYEKDSIAALDPTVRLQPNTAELARFPEAQRWTGYFLAQRGIALRRDLPTPGSAALEQLYADGEAWLAGGRSTAARRVERD